MTIAAEIDLNIQMLNSFSGEDIRDGTKVGVGRVTYRDAHVGFQVWSSSAGVAEKSNRYYLQGQSSRHQFRVRLEGSNWHPSGQGENGIQWLGSADNATFDIVADGDQSLFPDRYLIELKSAPLFP